MTFRKSLSWLIVALSLSAPAAYAEDTAGDASLVRGDEAPVVLQERVTDESDDESKEPKATKNEVEAVRSEIQVLRDQWQRSLDTKVVQAGRPVTISGIGQLRYTQTLDDDPTTPTSISIPFFSLNFKGNLRKDYLEGKDLDYTIGIQTTGNSAVSITDAWLSYQILNSLDKEGPRLSITGGQQKKYFGIEATATEAFKPTIVVAQFASKLSLDQRDIGFVLAGDLLPANDYGYNYRVPTIQYWLGAINGTGPNTAENNDNKDVFGRIQLNAPVNYDHWARGVSLGLSGYKGRGTYTATNTTTNTIVNGTGQTVSSSSSVNLTQKGDKERWGADLAYVNTPVGFTLEYVRGKDLAVTNGTVRNGAITRAPGFNEVDAEGYTFTLFYNFGDQFVNAIKVQDRYDDWFPLTYQPFVRFDRFVPDTDFSRVRSDIWTIGFNWFFAATTKLQVNYNIKREHPDDKDNDQFLAQFQFGF